jgi:hypothetical protein
MLGGKILEYHSLQRLRRREIYAEADFMNVEFR